TGVRYDSDSLVSERESVYGLMQREGYFDFLRQYVRFEVDTNARNNQAALKLIIENPADKPRHTVYHIDSSIITIKNSHEEMKGVPDRTQLAEKMTYIDYSHKFKA